MTIELNKTKEDFLREIGTLVYQEDTSVDNIQGYSGADGNLKISIVNGLAYKGRSLLALSREDRQDYLIMENAIVEMLGNAERHGGGLTGVEVCHGSDGSLIILRQKNSWDFKKGIEGYFAFEKFTRTASRKTLNSLEEKFLREREIRAKTDIDDIVVEDPSEEPVYFYAELARTMYGSEKTKWGQGMQMFGFSNANAAFFEQLSLSFAEDGRQILIRYRPKRLVPESESYEVRKRFYSEERRKNESREAGDVK